jgi:hypothetical protein
MLSTFISVYLPLGLFFFLHFSQIQGLVKRKNLWLALSILFVFLVYTSTLYYNEGSKWNRHNILSLLPTSYLILAVLMRYLIFNKFFSPFFHKDKPYDPVLIYPGVFTFYWDEKNYIPGPIEYIYSFAILVLPWWIFLLL